MKIRLFRKILYLSVGGVCFLAFSNVDASALQDKLKSAGENIDRLERQREDAKDKVGALKEEESALKGTLYELNAQLFDTSTQINDLEAQILSKQEAILQTGKALKKEEKAKKRQYETMKLRIQFIYENGVADLASMLLSSSSLADFLNKAEYVASIHRYDRQALSNFEETCKQIETQKENLQKEEAEFIALQETVKEKEAQVKSLIAQTKASIDTKQGEISAAKETVEDYDKQIAKMKAYEEELERKKAEEAKKRAQEQKKATNQKKIEESGGGSVTSNDSDVSMLAALVECEAGGESYEGQLAVASVVVNRVKSSLFPNTISGVIYQGGQFSPVTSGRFAIVLARGAAASCTQAANAALSGGTNVDCLYFCRASFGVEGTLIGNHVFY